MRWQLSSWYECCIPLNDLFIRSCDFRYCSIFGTCYHFVRQQLLVPCFSSRSRWFSSSFCKDSFFFATFWNFVFLLLWHHCLPELLSWCLAFVLSKIKHMKVEHERKCTKCKYEIAVSVATRTTCKRTLADTTPVEKKVGASAKSKKKLNSKWLP